ncbi:putative quinol monooxygenase [Nocardia tengchongensis]|uniref:putative quinol monooxygenase n=1 Tax=Nocardia tengchongensis TaxID=2055889 RepID=UPI0036A91DBA
MTLTAVSTLQARAGKEDLVRAQALALIEPTLAEPGCVSYQPYQHPTRPGDWVVVESWESRAAFEAHMTSPHLLAAFQAGADLLTGPPVERIFEG